MSQIEKLKSVLPSDILAELSVILSKRTLSNNELAHLLAQCEHECGWKNYVENLNYKPDRLLAIFPKRIGSLENAKKLCALGQKAIANALYNGRMGNASGSDDGWNYRGSGCLQLTGRDNYTFFNKTVDENIIDNPDLVRTKYRLTSAFWFFDFNKLWSLCATDDPTALRKRVNGGTIGIDHVKTLFVKYKNLLK
jgi:putative chitinase